MLSPTTTLYFDLGCAWYSTANVQVLIARRYSAATRITAVISDSENDSMADYLARP
jgi:hypothetical protein